MPRTIHGIPRQSHVQVTGELPITVARPPTTDLTSTYEVQLRVGNNLTRDPVTGALNAVAVDAGVNVEAPLAINADNGNAVQLKTNDQFTVDGTTGELGIVPNVAPPLGLDEENGVLLLTTDQFVLEAGKLKIDVGKLIAPSTGLIFDNATLAVDEESGKLKGNYQTGTLEAHLDIDDNTISTVNVASLTGLQALQGEVTTVQGQITTIDGALLVHTGSIAAADLAATAAGAAAAAANSNANGRQEAHAHLSTLSETPARLDHLRLTQQNGSGTSVDLLTTRYDANWGMRLAQNFVGPGNVRYDWFNRFNGVERQWLTVADDTVTFDSPKATFSGAVTVANATFGGPVAFGSSSFGPPTFTTRSVGSRAVLIPGGLTSTSAEYAVGIEAGAMWFGVPTTSQGFNFYGGTTRALNLSGDGTMTVNTVLVPSGGKLKLRTDTPAAKGDYSLSYGNSGDSLHVHLAGSDDSTGHRQYQFGYYTADTVGTWNSKVAIDTYDGSGSFAGFIQFPSGATGPPTFTTRSAGCRLSLYPASLSATATDYAIGLQGGAMWFGVPDTVSSFNFYGGTTLGPQIKADGSVTAANHLTTKAYVDGVGAAAVTAGTGLTKTGSTLSVNAAQPQITSVGTLTDLAVTGNVTAAAPTAADHLATKTYVDSAITNAGVVAGTGLTLTGTTLSVNAAQTQITSVGTLDALTVAGAVTANSLFVPSGGKLKLRTDTPAAKGDYSIIYNNSSAHVHVAGSDDSLGHRQYQFGYYTSDTIGTWNSRVAIDTYDGSASFQGTVTVGGNALFPSGSTGPPTFTTRSVGSRLSLYPSLSGTATDYAVGVQGGALWFGVPDTASSFRFYGGTTLGPQINADGSVTAANHLATKAYVDSTVAGGGGSYQPLNSNLTNLSHANVPTFVVDPATMSPLSIRTPMATTGSRTLLELLQQNMNTGDTLTMLIGHDASPYNMGRLVYDNAGGTTVGVVNSNKVGLGLTGGPLLTVDGNGNVVANGTLTATGNMVANGALTATGTVTGATPTASGHLATKAYVDTATAGMRIQQVVYGSAANNFGCCALFKVGWSPRITGTATYQLTGKPHATLTEQYDDITGNITMWPGGFAVSCGTVRVYFDMTTTKGFKRELTFHYDLPANHPQTSFYTNFHLEIDGPGRGTVWGLANVDGICAQGSMTEWI